jgi:flagella basal body P-ring formation protein FlgA
MLSIALSLIISTVWADELEVLVPNRPIMKNEIITEADVSVGVAEKKGSYIQSIEGNVVKARRNLEEGKPIKTSDVIIDNFLIHKGDMVTVRFARKNLLIEVQGLAMNNGAIGEAVKVKNLETNKMLHGKVTSDGFVEVQ